jgi:thiamine pyrophosphokinase
MTELRAIIFLNGELRNLENIRTSLKISDYLVAVDGGLHHLKNLGSTPHLLIGDLDSVLPEDLEWINPEKTEVIQFPTEKDETDFELAVDAVLKKGFHTIRVIAALGGRFDQTLGNLFLISSPELADCNVVLDDGYQEVFLIKERGEICGNRGDLVSLLPFGGNALDVKTAGLKYTLDSEVLFPDRTRGISNVLVEDKAVITLEGGILICIHIRNGNTD